MKTETKKCVAYARVSSKEQEEGYSLDSQEKLLRDYAQKNGHIVARVFRVSESANGKQIRKIFNEMLQFASKQSADIVLCEKIDRLTRNLKDAAVAADWIADGEDREIHFVKENFIVSKNTRAHENLVWDMKVAIARFYSNNLSEEVRKGQAEKLAQGGYPTTPPLGYQTVGDRGQKTIAVDESVAPFIRRAFDLYASGNYSMSALTELLHREGLRSRRGRKVNKSNVEYMLKEPFYYGAMRWNDVIHENGKHDPLISKELFDKATAVRTGKTAPQFKRRFFQFRKLLNCGECGGTITAEIKKGRYIYYHCNHYRQCSQRKATPEKSLEQQLFGVFKVFESITESEATRLKAKIKQNHAQEIEYKEKTLNSLNDGYMRFQGRLDRLYDDRLDGKITPEYWEKKDKEIRDQQNEIQEQIKKLKGSEAEYFQIWLNILDLAMRARAIYDKRTPEQRRLLLAHIFSNLMLKDGKVAYTLKTPVQKLAERVQQRLDTEKTFEKSNSGSTKGKSDSFESLHPDLCALLDDFRTIDWDKEYPYPSTSLGELRQLVA